MLATRRLVPSLLCVTTLTAALVAATPAVADQLAQRSADCGAMPQDYSGTFSGTFDHAPGDDITVTFNAPESVTTSWTVEGWKGHGTGTFELAANGVQWNNADTVTGPATGVDTETYQSTDVTCAAGTTEVERIKGEVVAPTPAGTVTYPFTVSRQA